MRPSGRSHAGIAIVAGACIAVLSVQVPAASTGPTTVADLGTALCGGATVPLQQDITEGSAVLTVAGGCTATLDLAGRTLTVQRVVLGAASDLTIRDTSSSTGRLIAASDQVGIRTTGATLRIESGTVSASGGFLRGAGIGGENGGSGGTVAISGGTVTATGGLHGAGIGGGEGGSGGTVTVSGGTVTATGGLHGAGIGGGIDGSGETVTVSGGTVTATGGTQGAGIGGGWRRLAGASGGTVTVSGGTVTATSGFAADWYGIGPGSGGAGGDVTIGPGLIRTDTEPAAGRRRTTLAPVPEPAPTPVLVPSVSCRPEVLVAGGVVACTVTGGDAGIDILWRAAYNPVIAETGVTLDASGSGTFLFTVPAAALGEELTVELVGWIAPVSLGVVGGPVPTSVPSGQGPVPVWPLGLLTVAGAFLGGLTLRSTAKIGPARSGTTRSD